MNLVEDLVANYHSNKVKNQDEAIHNWYRFVLSFPPHLVQHYINKFHIGSEHTILDPFAGTGTTLVESKLNGINSVGIEANPVTKFATHTKLNWNIDTENLADTALSIAHKLSIDLKSQGIIDSELIFPEEQKLLSLPEKEYKLLIKNSISPKALHKTLALLKFIKNEKCDKIRSHLLLAFLKSTVKNVSNLRFGPEIGVGKIKEDAEVIAPWLNNVLVIKRDLEQILQSDKNTSSEIYLGDSRSCNQYLDPSSINAVITSPPYPNEKDYSRTTRLENVLLGLIKDKLEMRAIKKTFVRSNTRSIYKDDKDDIYIKKYSSIIKLAEKIESKRMELGKTSGFERMYYRVVLQYFGGMTKHLANLRTALAPGAKLAYVVGDQASFFRIMIRTGTLLSEIAQKLNYEVEDLELFRTRMATATKEQLREEVLILKWKG